VDADTFLEVGSKLLERFEKQTVFLSEAEIGILLSRGIRRRRPLSLREPPLRCYGRSGRYAAYCT
ncbi:hypothetical protein NE555_16945, partial [Alistipes onderdonkii]|uniref:hypothetical protein n=1 Tax=Alistipes onderdonkii TaxID=328813 RepID=UPI00210B729D